MRWLGLPACSLVALTAVACPATSDTKDSGTTPSKAEPHVVKRRFSPVQTKDPVGELTQLLGGRRGYCVQFRALPEKADALMLAERIEKEAKLPVALIAADIKGRGTWYRLCAGAEPSVVAATKKANGWTATGGKLSPYMEPTAPGQAKYFVKERPLPSQRMPSEAQARLVLAARPDGERPVRMAAIAPTADALPSGYLAVVTTPKRADGTKDGLAVDVLAVDPRGRPVEIVGEGAPGCVACGAAMASAAVVSRRVLAVGNVAAGPSEEVFIEETTAKKSRVLVVLRQVVDDTGRMTLVRHAAYWLGTELTGLRLMTQVETVEADGDAEKELALILTELPIYKNRLCALRKRAELHDLTPQTPRALDENYARAIAVTEDAAKSGEASILLVRALDRVGDFRAGSRMCAAYLSRGQDVALTRHCLNRITRLVKEHRKIEAVNAAGMLAESAASLRAVIAGPFFTAVTALNRDARLTVADDNCAQAPLVTNVDGRPLSQTLRIANAAKKERVNLAELVDAVFVTGARDFGPKTPVGKVTAKWLERLRIALPARFAAIEALLAEPISENETRLETRPDARHETREGAPPPVAPAVERVGERFIDERAVDSAIGRPRIILKVHDEEAGAQ